MSIQSTNISFTYTNTASKALENISFTIPQGECIVLCGKSGCGKTTFSRIVNGLIPHYYQGELEGKLTINNTEYTNIKGLVGIVGSVFQNPRTQYFNSNTTEELAFSCENIGLSPKDIQQRIDDISKELGISHLLNRSIFYLSGGEKQKLAFASACILDPPILVLDEPSSNLDSKAIEDLASSIKTMKEKGVTILISEHRLYWLKDLADRYILLNHKKVQEWKSQEFLQLSSSQREKYGLRASDISQYLKTIQMKQTEPNSKALLSCHDLKIGYSKQQPLRTVNLSLYEGEIVGIMGHNGLGKSTLIKTMCGLLRPIDGTINYKQHKTTTKQLKQHSFLVMQDVNYQLFCDTVKEEVLLGATKQEKLEEVLDMLSLTELSDRHPVSLSGGQKQRVAIASALLSGKDILYLDEPTSGLDYYHMQQVGHLLQQIKENHQTIVVITHDEEFAATWCDRIIQLERN